MNDSPTSNAKTRAFGELGPQETKKPVSTHRGRQVGVSLKEISDRKHLSRVDIENNGARLIEDLLNVEVEERPAIANYLRIKEMDQKISLEKLDPTANVHPQEIDLFGQGNMQSGRRYDLRRQLISGDAWVLEFENKEAPKDSYDEYCSVRFDKSRVDKGNVKLLAMIVPRILDRIPSDLSLPMRSLTFIMRMVEYIALKALLQENSSLVDVWTHSVAIIWEPTSGSKSVQGVEDDKTGSEDFEHTGATSPAHSQTPTHVKAVRSKQAASFIGGVRPHPGRYISAVNIILPDGRIKSIRLSIKVDCIDLARPHRNVPTWIKFTGDEPPAELDGEARQRHQLAIGHLRYLIWRLNGTSMSSEMVYAYFSAYKEQNMFTKYERTKTGVYRGKNAFKIRHDRHFTRISIGAQPLKDIVFAAGIKRKIKDIRILSTMRERVGKVVAVWLAEWKRSSDYLEGLICAAKMADWVNQMAWNGLATPTICGCGGASSECFNRICDSCDLLTACKDLKQHVSGLFCDSCYESVSTAGSAKGVFKKMLRYAARTESILLKHTKPEFEEAAERLEESVLLGIPEEERDYSRFPDIYAPTKIRERSTPLFRARRNPFWYSLDAIRPVYRTDAGKTGLHCPDNVAVTSQYLNFACSLFPKGLLAVIAAYMRRDINKGQLCRHVVNIRGIANTYPRSQRLRVGQPMSQQAFNKYDVAFRTLCCDPLKNMEFLYPTSEKRKRVYLEIQEEMPHVKNLHKIFAPPRPNWRPGPEFERTHALIEEIQRESVRLYGESAPQMGEGEDGCPFPFEPLLQPKGWNWWSAWCVIGAKLSNLWALMNADYTTYDDIENLFLEYIWAYCIGSDRKYRWLSDLPLDIAPGGPLTVVLGHERPGQGMRTGWSRRQPRSILDRDEAQRNFCVETNFENWAKSNYVPEYYQLMREDLMAVDLPADIFDPDYLQVDPLLESCQLRVSKRGLPGAWQDSSLDREEGIRDIYNSRISEHEIGAMTLNETDSEGEGQEGQSTSKNALRGKTSKPDEFVVEDPSDEDKDGTRRSKRRKVIPQRTLLASNNSKNPPMRRSARNTSPKSSWKL